MSDLLALWQFEKDRYTIELIKIVLTLSSGNLIVSLGFLAYGIQLTYKLILYISWALLVVSIIFGISAIGVGIIRYDRIAKGAMSKLKGREKDLYEKGNVLTSFQANTPDIQVWSFAIGLISFLIFVFLNTYNAISW